MYNQGSIIDFCSIKIVEIGENLPCLNIDSITVTMGAEVEEIDG